MALSLTFYITLMSLIGFLTFKYFDLRHSFRWYKSVRTAGDTIVLYVAQKVQDFANKIVRQLSLRTMVHVVTHSFALMTVHLARKVEHKAHEVTRNMSRKMNAETRATNSSFLREVTTHKESLDTERVKRETSLTADE